MMSPRSLRPAGDPPESPTRPKEVDDAVIARMKRGEISALEEVFDVYGSRVFGVCFGILGNRDEAEDASQEIFLRAFRQTVKFSGQARYSTWLFRLAANYTLNHARASRRRKRLSESLLEETVSTVSAPDSAAIVSERRDAVAELLQQIPPKHRQVLVLREMEGLSYAELAKVLGVPIGTVTSRLIRGRKKLRDLVRESGLKVPDIG